MKFINVIPKNFLLLILFFLIYDCSWLLAQTIPSDTINPEQVIPYGATIPEPKRISAHATTESFEARVDPPNWWVGFKNKNVELMIHDKNIGNFKPNFYHQGVRTVKTQTVENANYLFVTLHISDTAQLGSFKLKFKNGNEQRSYNWKLEKRNAKEHRNLGLNEADFMYLIMPDRFANGDTTNDSYTDMKQVGIDRRKMYFRHGGDLKGIQNHLDYVKNLGVTAVWLNPVQENDEVSASYHGYAVTDWYKIDKRLGSLTDYKNLVNTLHQQKMKMVMDVIPNHSGNENYFIKDLPETNWIHQLDSFRHPNYRDQVLSDPHVAASDLELNQNAWFDKTMPDMNPEGNPHVARYIIQNHLWWLEETGVDAFRIDSYFYNDMKFMSDWAKALRSEFPKLFLFGESTVESPINLAYFSEKSPINKKFDSHLQSNLDYPLYISTKDAFTNAPSWTGGIMKLWSTIGQDYIYNDASKNVIFLDNHDQPRFYSVINENLNKYKSAIAYLLTTRGIPQTYYGDELGFTGFTNPDGKVRQDMPGGWQADKVSVFKETERTPLQKEIYDYTAKLAHWRAKKTFLQTGKLTHYIPEDGVYVYFRQDASGGAMIIINGNDTTKTISTKRFNEILKNYVGYSDFISHQKFNTLDSIDLDKRGVRIIELSKE